MISADLVTAAVLITFGVVYGFVSPCQLVVICLIEPLAMKFNEHIVIHYLSVSLPFITQFLRNWRYFHLEPCEFVICCFQPIIFSSYGILPCLSSASTMAELSLGMKKILYNFFKSIYARKLNVK